MSIHCTDCVVSQEALVCATLELNILAAGSMRIMRQIQGGREVVSI